MAAYGYLQEYENRLEFEDLRNLGDTIDESFFGELTDAQHQAARIIVEHDKPRARGATGFRKTVRGTYLIAQRNCSTLVLVHGQPLLEQWRSQIEIFLDRNMKTIGQIGGGMRKLTGLDPRTVVENTCVISQNIIIG